jgi:hypothetical protein
MIAKRDPTSPEEIARCRRAMETAAARWTAWSETPEGRAALDAGWEKQKAKMRARGMVPLTGDEDGPWVQR